MQDHPTAPPRAQTTWLAVALMLGLSAFFVADAVQTLTGLSGEASPELERRLALVRVSIDAGPSVLMMIAAVVLVLTALYTTAALGVLARRQWARETAALLAGIFALVVTPLSIGGMVAEPPAASALEGVLAGVANVAVVVLLVLPRTGSDFSAFDHWRQRRRQPAPRGRPA